MYNVDRAERGAPWRDFSCVYGGPELSCSLATASPQRAAELLTNARLLSSMDLALRVRCQNIASRGRIMIGKQDSMYLCPSRKLPTVPSQYPSSANATLPTCVRTPELYASKQPLILAASCFFTILTGVPWTPHCRNPRRQTPRYVVLILKV